MAHECETLSQLTEGRDELAMLKCLQLGIARQLEQTESARDTAALSRQFMDVTREIRALEKARPNPNRKTALDEARSKRKKSPKRKART